MNEIINNITEAERGGLTDLGKALRKLLTTGGGSGVVPANTTEFHAGSAEKLISPAIFFDSQIATNLIDEATITINMISGLNFVVVITDDRFFDNPINVKAGQDGIILIIQDAIGGHQPTWGVNWKFNGTPVLYDGPHAWTLIRYWAQTLTTIRCTIEGGGSEPVSVATVDEIREGLESLKYISPSAYIDSRAPITLIDEEPIFIDLADGINFSLTLTADRSVDSPLDQKPGRSGEITIIQGGTGGYSLSWHSDWKFLDGAPTLPSAVGASATLRYRVVAIGNVLVTPQPIAAKVADYWNGISPNLFLSPSVAVAGLAPVDLTDESIITPDFSLGILFSLTIGGDRLISNPVNQKRQTGFLYIKQDGVGGHSISWGDNWQFIGGFPPVIPTDPAAEIIIPYWCMSDGVIICSSGESTSGSTGSTGIIAATTTETRLGINGTKYVTPSSLSGFFSPTVLLDGETIVPDLNISSTFIITLGGNRIVANIANQRVGFTGQFIIIQDATGSRTITWGNNYSFQGGLPVRSPDPGTWCVIPFVIQDLGVIRCVSPLINPIPAPASITSYRAGTSTTAYISPSVATAGNAPVALTDEATITVDFAIGRAFRVVLEGDRSIASPLNQLAGQSGVFLVYQDDIGGRLLTWGSDFKPDGDAILIGTNPNQKTVVPYFVESTGIVHIG